MIDVISSEDVVEPSTTPRTVQASAAVWRRRDAGSPEAWTVELSDDQRLELAAVGRAARRAGATAADLRAEDAPLPSLAADLASWSGELAEGRGFVLVRGFPVDLLDPVETELAWIALGAHLGTPVGQNGAGDLLTHVLDERLPEGGPTIRRYRTRKRQDFHTDGADIIGLLCLRRAQRGGESRIASSGAVYNEILARRPDLLEVLYEPMPWDRQGDEGPGEAPWFSLPPLHDLDGVARFFYIGWYVRDSQRHPDAPRLTADQMEAMELVESIANDPAFHVEMDFHPGDVQLLNNARILHAREAYEDAEEPTARRHLLRLWLAAHHFSSVEPELRAGLGGTRDAPAG